MASEAKAFRWLGWLIILLVAGLLGGRPAWATATPAALVPGSTHNEFIGEGFTPVSYTHLDVYKRQPCSPIKSAPPSRRNSAGISFKCSNAAKVGLHPKWSGFASVRRCSGVAPTKNGSCCCVGCAMKRMWKYAWNQPPPYRPGKSRRRPGAKLGAEFGVNPRERSHQPRKRFGLSLIHI